MSVFFGQDFIDIITEFYCSVSGKKDIQKLTTEISDFVMNSNSILDKQNMGKLILSYFLKLYTKFNMKTQQEWDHAFELASAQDRAAKLIATFPERQMYKWSFMRLKQRNTLSERYSQTIFTQISGNQMTIIDEIEVQDDIKLKTTYFFKWCLYMKNAKNFKSMKMKNIQNMKISHCFNTYGIKFNYFTAWKMLVSRKKLYMEREDCIRRRSRNNILATYFRKMSETGKIILIEDRLASVISNKIQALHKMQALKYLKINSQFVKCGETGSYGQNLYAYRFIELCSRGVKILMNRSSVHARDRFNLQYQKCLMGKIIKHMKNRVYHKESMQKQVQTYIRTQRIKNLFDNSKTNAQLKQNTQNIVNYLMFKKKKISLTILHFNMITNRQQKFQEASTLQSRLPSLVDRRILEVHKKKQLQTRSKQLFFKINRKAQQSVLKKLIQRRQNKKTFQHNCQKLTYLWKDRFFVCDRHNKKKLEEKKLLYGQIAKIWSKNLQRRMINRWKKIKQANQVQRKSLHSVSLIFNRTLERMFLRKMESRVTENERFQKFVDMLRLVILKVGFQKIGGRTFYINREVLALNQRRAFDQMSNLFQLLQSNSKYNQQLSQTIHSFTCQQASHKLIKSLMNLKQLQNKCTTLSNYLQRSNKQKYLKHFSLNMKKDKLIQQKTNYLCLKLFVTDFRRSIINQQSLHEEMSRRTQALQEHLCMNSAVRFLNRLKIYSKKRNIEAEKLYCVMKMRVSQKVEKMQSYIKDVRVLLETKDQQIRMRRGLLSRTMKKLSFGYKKRKSEELVQRKKKREGLDKMMQVFRDRVEDEDKKTKIGALMYRCQSKNFLKYMIAENQEIQHKETLLNHQIQQSNTRSKLQFISLIQQNKQNQSAFIQLLTSKIHKHLSELLKTFYSRKYGKIKHNYSLKLYATNLLKRAMKGMKRELQKIRQKENTLKFEKSSWMIGEKSIQRSFKSNSLCEQIEKFNIRKSRQIR